jgi:hypothetical protein
LIIFYWFTMSGGSLAADVAGYPSPSLSFPFSLWFSIFATLDPNWIARLASTALAVNPMLLAARRSSSFSPVTATDSP